MASTPVSLIVSFYSSRPTPVDPSSLPAHSLLAWSNRTEARHPLPRASQNPLLQLCAARHGAQAHHACALRAAGAFYNREFFLCS